MSAEELAKEIAAVPGFLFDEKEVQAIADHLTAAGWVKHRIISTAEELRELPVGSLVMDADPDVCKKVGRNTWQSLNEGSNWTYATEGIVDSGPFYVVGEPLS